MYLIVYRPHNRLNCETQYIGPYAGYDAAMEDLEALPALGAYADDGVTDRPGVRYIAELRPALDAHYGRRSISARLNLLNAHTERPDR